MLVACDSKGRCSGQGRVEGQTVGGVGDCLILRLSPGPEMDKGDAHSDTQTVRDTTFLAKSKINPFI
jgi:hypothetical protein